MEANELRVNNYYVGGFEITGLESRLNLTDTQRVFKLTLEHLLVLSSNPQWLSTIKPLPLTRDVLFKFGIKEMHGKMDFDTHFILPYSYINLRTNELEHADWMKGKKIPYAHNLQNICFALTGKELPYNA